MLAISLVLGFLTVYLGTPYARVYLTHANIVAIDQQKSDRPLVPTSGGVVVIFGFVVAITSYLGLTTFLATDSLDVAILLGSLCSVLIISLIGLIDDLNINVGPAVDGGDHLPQDVTPIDVETMRPLPHHRILDAPSDDPDRANTNSEPMLREGLNRFPKMIFVLPAALPLIAIGVGSWTMVFPIVGTIHWGIFYPLVLLPLGLLFVSNVVNMLAGMNGLATGMSLVASTAIGINAISHGSLEAATIAFSLSACLLAFFWYNRFPASILPGDSLTYLCGAGLFTAIVVGDMERFGAVIFLPWIIEFVLKLRSGFSAHSWGQYTPDGIDCAYDKTYSLTHPLMRRGFSERQITASLMGIEILICVVALGAGI